MRRRQQARKKKMVGGKGKGAYSSVFRRKRTESLYWKTLWRRVGGLHLSGVAPIMRGAASRKAVKKPRWGRKE